MEKLELNIQLFAANISISASETDVNIQNNTSYINLIIYVSTTGATWNETGSAYFNASISGQNNSYNIQNTSFKIGQNTTKAVFSGKIGPFTHNTDGSLSNVSISAYAYLTSSTNASTTSSCKMSTIARASSFSVTNAIIEGNSTITINRASSNFTHTLTYSFGSLNGTIATGVTMSRNWNIPSTFYNQIPNTKTGNCTITCITYNGSAEIGRTSKTITISCNESSCKPVLKATIVDVNSKTINLTGDSSKLIRYASTARITPTATAKNGAKISKITVEGTTTSTYKDISNPSKNSFVIVAIDSRGFSTTITETATMINYIKLTSGVMAKRTTPTSGQIRLDFYGNYFNDSFGSVANTLQAQFRIVESGQSINNASWNNLTTNITGNLYKGNITISDCDYKKNYEMQIRTIDKISTLIVNISVTKGKPVVCITPTSFKVLGNLNVDGEIDLYYESDNGFSQILVNPRNDTSDDKSPSFVLSDGESHVANQTKITSKDIFFNNISVKNSIITASGSNNNGSYVKFGDGTMICTIKYNFKVNGDLEQDGIFYRKIFENIPFPQNFVDIPFIIATPTTSVSTRQYFVSTFGISKNNIGSASIYSYWNEVEGDGYINFLVIGKWK